MRWLGIASITVYNEYFLFHAHISLSRSLVFMLIVETFYAFNPLSANPTNGQTHSYNLLVVASELFECVWPFCGVDA